jgi:uncharacterized protein
LALKISAHLVGLISDTHGLIRPEALDALRDSDLILHCGDVGDLAVLDALRGIAPVRAVRGNNDAGSWASDLPAYDMVEIGSHTICVVHNLSELRSDAHAPGPAIVVYGHSHQPVIEKRRGTLFVNPGSAGPRRFKLPVTVAMLTLRSRYCTAKIMHLRLKEQNTKYAGD